MNAAGPGSPELTIAVATRDRPRIIERWLLASVRAADLSGCEVLIVDQSAGPETRELCAGDQRLRLLRSEPPLSRGRNVAIAEARAPLIAFLDDDVEFAADWPRRLRAVFEANPDAGAVCGAGVDSAGNPIVGAPPGVYRHPTSPWDLGHGFNLAFRRRALASAGDFDESLGAGTSYRAGEDADMLWRVMAAGMAVVCDAGIVVTHHDWRHGREARELIHGYGIGAGAQTAKGVRGRDAALARNGAREVARHVAWGLGSLRARRSELAIRHLRWLTGFARGFARRLASRGEAGAEPGTGVR